MFSESPDALIPRPGRITTILFDLDGTLIESRMHLFLPAYYDGLAACVSGLMEKDAFVAHLRAATRAMIENDGSATNEEVFNRRFYPLAGRGREELQPLFDRYYREDYPALRAITQEIPLARESVRLARRLGFRVAIATNPLFPATAIFQRIRWAGLRESDFEHVTTYENSRACKPNLLYYRELLERLGCSASECLLIGDEEWDMVARDLGIATFLVRSSATERKPVETPPVWQGDLAAFMVLLRRLRDGSTAVQCF